MDEGNESIDPAVYAQRLTVRRAQKKKSASRLGNLPQIKLQILKETFNMLDNDHDGIISKADLKMMYATLGQTVDDGTIDNMLEATGVEELRFNRFCTMMCAEMSEMDEDQILMNAFDIIDENHDGFIPISSLCHMLMTTGYERMTSKEVDDMLDRAPVNGEGELDIKSFIKVMKGTLED